MRLPSLFLGALLIPMLAGCLSLGGSGVVFQQESRVESWVRFYRIDPELPPGTAPGLISNVSLRGENRLVVIDPSSRENRLYWVKDDGRVMRSYENPQGGVGEEEYFRSFRMPGELRAFFIDWRGRASRDGWRKTHFVYFVDGAGAMWGVNDETEIAERWKGKIQIPPYARDICLLFDDQEYPVRYIGADQAPSRVNARTGREQKYLDILIEARMLVDEVTGSLYEIEDGDGLVCYDDRGQRIVKGKVIPENGALIAPRIVGGVLYFGMQREETVTSTGKALF